VLIDVEAGDRAAIDRVGQPADTAGGGGRRLPGQSPVPQINASARSIAAWERAVLADHAARRGADQVLFHRTGPTVSLGCHQYVEHEVRRDHCLRTGIDIVRRVTGGGALYLDGGHQGMSLVVPASSLGASVAQRLEAGVRILADALARFGIAAAFKAPNDLETEDGRKIGSVFLAEEGPSALLYANVIVTLDLEAALQALLVPTEKLTRTGLEQARDRMTSLEELLGAVPDAGELRAALLSAAQSGLDRPLCCAGPVEEAAAQAAAPAWSAGPTGFETIDRTSGATLRVLLDIADGTIVSSARFASDAHIAPRETFRRLAGCLTGQRLADSPKIAAGLLDEIAPDMAGCSARDIAALLGRAVAKHGLQQELGLSAEETTAVMLAGAHEGHIAPLTRAGVMLVPYCAKPAWCAWRHHTDCVECGRCDVGEAYRMGRERNMEVLTIVNYEHLVETLAEMKRQGVESYVGMCCGEFFLKRHAAFRDCGMAATLVDIKGATCYELKQEQLAYAGRFSAEAALDLDTLEKVMACVPSQEPSGRVCLSCAAPPPPDLEDPDS
jgi:lipoate-protein ligase A